MVQNENRPDNLSDAAADRLSTLLRYADLGWPLVPLHWVQADGSCTCKDPDPNHKGGKHPILKSWAEDATADRGQVRRWADRWPSANFGIACREGGVFMIGPDGEQGVADLARLEAENGPLPPHPIQASGTPPGQHHVFRWPQGVAIKNRQPKKGEVIAHRGCRIDVRGRGGQFVVAPSRIAAGQYRWIVPPWEVPPPDPPDWLLRWLEDEEKAASGQGVLEEIGRFNDRYGPRTGTATGRPSVEDRAIDYLATIDPAVSGQGGHAQTMWAARCMVWGFDLGESRGYDVLASHYNPRCRPPWSEKELRHKAAEADKPPFSHARGWLKDQEPHHSNGEAKTPPGGGAGTKEDDHLTDLGNARRLNKAHGQDLRWVRAWKKWLAWDGCRWKDGDQFDVRKRGEQVITDLFLRATDQMNRLANDKSREAAKRLIELQQTQTWAKKSEDAKRLNSMVDLLRSQPGIGIDHDELDNNGWLLNCPNGVLDLKTGRLAPHRRGDHLTRLCPTRFDPDARCPHWEQFLCEIFVRDDGPDVELIHYLQRLLGYCLTGDVSEHLLAVLYGCGANGKSVLVNVVRAVIGHELTCVAAPDLLLARNFDKHPCEIANLFGKRVVVCQEVGTGRRLNEALVKWLTGGDHLQARRMREDLWEFAPTHKAFLVSNHRPEIAGTDNGIWRRVRLIPFDVTIPPERQDKTLTDRLIAEAPGILAWMVRGCRHWQEGGLREPDRVRMATEEYRTEEDVVGRFLCERCVVAPAAQVRSDALYSAFAAWSKTCGEQDVPSRRKFGEAMNGREGISRCTSNGTIYRGVGLISGSAAGHWGEAGQTEGAM